MLNVGGAPASKVYVGSTPAKAVYVGDTQVWPDAVDEPLWLYDVDITYKGSNVVDFALKKGLTGIDPLDEGFMFRCAQFSSLNGYVPRNFTKTFPVSAYSALDCTVEDLYGDGTANPEYLYKTISFQVSPRP